MWMPGINWVQIQVVRFTSSRLFPLSHSLTFSVVLKGLFSSERQASVCWIASIIVAAAVVGAVVARQCSSVMVQDLLCLPPCTLATIPEWAIADGEEKAEPQALLCEATISG